MRSQLNILVKHTVNINARVFIINCLGITQPAVDNIRLRKSRRSLVWNPQFVAVSFW